MTKCVNGDMRMQACSECIVRSHHVWKGCSENGRGEAYIKLLLTN